MISNDSFDRYCDSKVVVVQIDSFLGRALKLSIDVFDYKIMLSLSDIESRSRTKACPANGDLPFLPTHNKILHF